MSTDKSRFRLSGQEYVVSLDVYSPRQWRLADVDSTGFDTGDTFPPLGDALVPDPSIRYWRGVKDISPITGSVIGGGWSTTLTVPAQGDGLADLEDFFCVDLMIRTWHGGLPGVVGAAGIDPGRVKIFRGYLRSRATADQMDYGELAYDMRGGYRFLQDSSFSRGIDWYPGSVSHASPVTVATLIDHLIFQHTNWHPRSEHSVYLPNQTFDTYEMSEGAIYNMLKGIADNAVLEGWVYVSREDQLVISGHPNMVGADDYGNGSSTLSTPIIDYDDTIVMDWDIPEGTAYEVASVSVTAITSTQQEVTRTFYIPGGLGSRERWPVTLRCDDLSYLDLMTARAARHLNRRFRGVKIHLPLNLAAGIGDIVTCTHKGRRALTTWSKKLFVVTDVDYSVDLDQETFTSVVTVDEIVL